MKKKLLTTIISISSVLLLSCTNESKFKEIRLSYFQRKEIINQISELNFKTLTAIGQIDIDIENKIRTIDELGTSNEKRYDGYIQGEYQFIFRKDTPIYMIDINSEIKFDDKELKDFTNTLYYHNDDKIYHTFDKNYEQENVFYPIIKKDEDTLLTPSLEDILDLEYVAFENKTKYKITLDLKEKVYSYLYQYAIIYYAKQNEKNPNNITSLEYQMIKNYVDNIFYCQTLKITLIIDKKLHRIENFDFYITTTITDIENTNVMINTYNKYFINGTMSSQITYDKELDFTTPNFNLFKESNGEEFKNLIDDFIH